MARHRSPRLIYIGANSNVDKEARSTRSKFARGGRRKRKCDDDMRVSGNKARARLDRRPRGYESPANFGYHHGAGFEESHRDQSKSRSWNHRRLNHRSGLECCFRDILASPLYIQLRKGRGRAVNRR